MSNKCDEILERLYPLQPNTISTAKQSLLQLLLDEMPERIEDDRRSVDFLDGYNDALEDCIAKIKEILR